MTISKRILIKWRKETLALNQLIRSHDKVELGIEQQIMLLDHMLELTQELIDQQLLKEAKNATLSR
jgi:hypothetical protein